MGTFVPKFIIFLIIVAVIIRIMRSYREEREKSRQEREKAEKKAREDYLKDLQRKENYLLMHRDEFEEDYYSYLWETVRREKAKAYPDFSSKRTVYNTTLQDVDGRLNQLEEYLANDKRRCEEGEITYDNYCRYVEELNKKKSDLLSLRLSIKTAESKYEAQKAKYAGLPDPW